MADPRSFGTKVYDNLIGIDDEYLTPGERTGMLAKMFGNALMNPIDTARSMVGSAPGAAMAVKDDLDNLMFEGGAEQRPEDVFGYASGLAAPSVIARRAANVLSANPMSVRGSDYFDPPREGGGVSKDPALYSPFSKVKHTTKAPHDFEATHTRGNELRDPDLITPSDLEGRDIFFATGDRTMRDALLESIGGRRLSQSVGLHGGPRYMDGPGSWASERGPMVAKHNVFRNYEGLNPVLGYLPMAERSGDFSHHMSDAFLRALEAQQAGNRAMNIGDMEGVTEHLKFGLPKAGSLSPQVAGSMPTFGTPDFTEWMLGQQGGDRATIIKGLDTKKAKDYGVPDVGEVRFAITEPDLIDANTLDFGYRLSSPSRSIEPSNHPSYSHQVPHAEGTSSMTLGDELVPWTIAARDTALPKVAANKGNPMAQPKDLKSYMGKPSLRQRADAQWVDEVSRYQELARDKGKGVADAFANELIQNFLQNR